MNKSTFLTTFFVVLSLTTYSQEPVNTGSYVVKEVVADLETEPVITNDAVSYTHLTLPTKA